jgi:prolyl-tRNA synthetase
MGALVMAHSDDEGLVLPPSLAPIQVVIVPIYRTDEEATAVNAQAQLLKAQLAEAGIPVKYDDRDTQKPGFKFAEWELKGVPVRIAIGPKDVANGTIELARRDTKTKQIAQASQAVAEVQTLLADIQQSVYQRAKAYLDGHITRVDTWEEFKDVLEQKGGFISAHWDGTGETEDRIKAETKATIRCIPLHNPAEEGTCIFSGRPSRERVLFARAY